MFSKLAQSSIKDMF
ncbi:hypothetical protein HEN90_005910 [Escherichia coli]|nr:hypothetical protein [Escherichia coli]EJI6583816.1 hypothetical protein [Escherichia coli]MBB6981406.1 hypothetical protein [Escherichia coli]MBS9562701.1 hypothetical protein [Escherichia coli]MBS9590033.1 hypothetical protein [Escherichia coli]MCA7636524.1 hypothetical protein [Escherichia coli]